MHTIGRQLLAAIHSGVMPPPPFCIPLPTSCIFSFGTLPLHPQPSGQPPNVEDPPFKGECILEVSTGILSQLLWQPPVRTYFADVPAEK